MMLRAIAIVGVVALVPTVAGAQNAWTVTTPGFGPKTYVERGYDGGYTITTPGQPTTYMERDAAGGYTVRTPGFGPRTYIEPSYVPSRR
jgi:hypothetical protein